MGAGAGIGLIASVILLLLIYYREKMLDQFSDRF